MNELIQVEFPDLDAKAITAKLAEEWAKLDAEGRAPYEAAAAKGTALSGTVVTKVEVSGSGAVTSASTQSSSLNSPSAEACIVLRFKAMSFASGSAGTISFPLGFQPNTEQ